MPVFLITDIKTIYPQYCLPEKVFSVNQAAESLPVKALLIQLKIDSLHVPGAYVAVINALSQYDINDYNQIIEMSEPHKEKKCR